MDFKLFTEGRIKEFGVTTTSEKLNVIQAENQFIKQAISSRSAGEQMVGVVGNAEGLERHIQQFRGLGFREKNIFVVEIYQKMFDLLRRKAQRLKSNVGVAHTNIFSPDNMPRNFRAHNVTHVDADITSSASGIEIANHVQQLETAYPSMKSLVLVYSLRKTNIVSSEHQEILKKEPYKSFIDAAGILVGPYSQTAIPYRTAAKNIIQYFLDIKSGRAEILNVLESYARYNFLVQQYLGKGGKSVMVSITGVKKPRKTKNNITMNDGAASYFTNTPSRTTLRMFNATMNDIEWYWSNNKAILPYQLTQTQWKRVYQLGKQIKAKLVQDDIS